MLLQANYQQMRKLMKPGDVIAFSGSGFISGAIKFFTRSSLSHVGVVNRVEADFKERVVLMESTTLNGKKGVQTTYLSDRIQGYEGPMWWLPLSKRSRETLDVEKFWQAINECEGHKYDYRQVVHFAVDLLHLWAQAENPSRLFCSELVALALKAGYVLPVWIDSSEVRPVDLAEFKIYSENYYQLKGKQTEIKGYNSRNPMEYSNG